MYLPFSWYNLSCLWSRIIRSILRKDEDKYTCSDITNLKMCLLWAFCLPITLLRSLKDAVHIPAKSLLHWLFLSPGILKSKKIGLAFLPSSYHHHRLFPQVISFGHIMEYFNYNQTMFFTLPTHFSLFIFKTM